MTPLNGIAKLTLLLVSSLTIMSIITISPALPMISDAFKEVPNSQFWVKLVLTIPALMIAIVAPIAGKLIDKQGRLKYLWVALILYALSGSAGYFINNLFVLLASRILLGIAVGLTMTIVITLVADYFQGKERQQFVGLQIAFMSLAGILFIGLGGFLADINWRAPFLIYLLALLVLPMALLFLKEPNITPSNIQDLSNKNAPPFIWLLFINTMIMWMIFFLIPVHIPFHLQSLGVESATMIGAAIAISTLFSAVSSFSFSKIKSRISSPMLFTFGYVLMSIAFALLFYSKTYSVVITGMILGGLGMGLLIPNTNMWVMRLAPIEIRGREMGKLTTFWFLGQFLSPLVMAPFLLILSLPQVFLLASFLLLLLAITFLFVKE